MNAGRAFLNIVLNRDRLGRLRAGESRNISHGHPGKVKEILKEFGDDWFGNDEARMTNVEGKTKIRGDLLQKGPTLAHWLF
jgi:hypothetical protein